MARKIPVLGRMLGTPALFAIVYGEIGSSLYFALGLTSVYALSATPFVFLAAGVLFALAAAAYAEGGATIAEPGGAASFARRAFNDLVGFFAGWAAALDYVIAISLSALFVPRYFTGAFGHPNALSDGQTTVAAVGILAVMTVIRLVRRPNVYAAGILLAVLDLAVQITLAVLGLWLLFDPGRLSNNINIGVAPTWSALAFSLPVAMVAYTGLEKVSSLTGLAKDPGRTVPASIRTSAITVVLIYAAVATAAVSAFPAHPSRHAPPGADGYASALSTTWVNTPILGLVHAIGRHTPWWFEDALRVGVGLTASAILILAIATSFSGFTRMAESLGRHMQLPAVFSRRSRRILAAPAAVTAAGVLSAGFVVVAAFFRGKNEETLLLASLFSFGILLAFTITQASIIWLRITEPDMPRAFMMHGNVRILGRLIPLTSVAGIILSFSAWVVALGTHPGARIVGPLWMLAGLCLYAAVRVRAGIPLLANVDLAEPPPATVTDLPQGPVVVPLERLDVIGEEMMATAFRLALDAGSVVVGVTAIVVPVRDPLDSPRPEREREAREVQDAAAALAEENECEYIEVSGRTRSPGRMVVDAAVEYNASLIVVGAPDKPRRGRTKEEEFFGRTVDFILRKAPCRVIVTHFPAEAIAAEAAVSAPE